METIQITATHPMVGDHTPKKWCDIVLGYHLQEQDITSYTFLEADGLDVKFSFKQEVPSEITVAEMCVAVYDFIEFMIGERDFTVNDISILTHENHVSLSVHRNGRSTA